MPAFAYTHTLARLLLLLLFQLPPLSSTSFSPPPGNSIALRVVALDGKLKYTCERDGGEWVLLQKTATLKDQVNHTEIVGFYASNHKLHYNSTHVGTWTLINNDADKAESGQPMSLVSGKLLAIKQNGTSELQDFLAQASLHRYEGSARRVSYISQIKAKVLSQLPSSKCEASKGILSINFKANYVFWRQDLLPPKVPRSLSVPTNYQPVEAFFAQGVIRYIYDHKLQVWKQRKVLARLYDVPGGIQVGGFTYNISLSTLAHSSHQHTNDGLMCITINSPNGFQVCGTEHVAPISVNESSIPWSLFHITRNIGYITRILGPFSFAQMVSTWEGLPPQGSATSFQVWKSSFTSILWLYTKAKV